MNQENQTQPTVQAVITPQTLKGLKELQRAGHAEMLVERLEEILYFFIEDAETSLSSVVKLEYIQMLRLTLLALKPFMIQEGGKA